MTQNLNLGPDETKSEEPVGPVLYHEVRRIPHLGHALLFVTIAAILLVLFGLVTIAVAGRPALTGAVHPKLQMSLQAATYIVAVGISWVVFPLFWHRGFGSGVRWNWPVARTQAARLIGLGLLLGAMMQFVTYFIKPPKTLPIDQFFATPGDAWLITVFGTFIAPVFEELCFRGFLLPAFAIAYDFLTLPTTEAARTHWQTTTTLTPIGLTFSAVLTSILFALMHFQQDAHLWAIMLVLFSVSLILTMVRVKTQSVAASAMVHAAYNFFVFLLMLIATGGYRHLDRINH